MSESNPYQPPATPAAPATAQAGVFSAAGRAVDAGRGWEWITAGWALFVRRPWLWIGIAFAWGVFTFIAHVIPPLALVNVIIGPALLGGLMLGAHALQAGGELTFNHLFAGFQKNFGTLLCVGLIYFASLLVITLIAAIVMGVGALKAMIAAMTAGDMMQNMESVVTIVMGSMMTILLGLLVALALLVPVAMILWFAPALIVLHDMGVSAAMKASFIACLKNIVPFLVYGVVLLIPFIVATMLVGLGWLVLGPVVVTSIYAAYRDIFVVG